MSSRQNSSRATGGHAPFDVPAGLDTFLALTVRRTGRFTPDQTRLLNRIANLINHELRTNESIGSVLPAAAKDDANLLHAMSLIQRDAMLAANDLSLFEWLVQHRFASLAPALDFVNAANLDIIRPETQHAGSFSYGSMPSLLESEKINADAESDSGVPV
ncbi:hypothetical protein KCU66_g14271, partial [Aureobasidium melanogenum]